MYQLLSGLSIIEVSSFVASPTAGLYCAQMGAEVIRIDDRRGGLDYRRQLTTREGRSLSWENLNRAKKSVALDLQSDEGRELAVELARGCGQVITNLPPDSFMAHARMAEGRPDLVSVRILGWHDGRQAMDFTVNAATGEGSEVRVPLGDVAIGTAFNAGAAPEMLYRGANRERIGNAIWGAFGRDFRSRDGIRFMIAALTAKQWRATVDAFGLAPDVAALEAELGEDFAASDNARFVHRRRLFTLFQRAAERFDYAEMAARLTRAGATFERYRTMHDMAQDPDLVTNNPLFGPSPANPSGFAYPAPRSFASIAGQTAGDPRPAPFLGEHTEEVLAERLGLSAGQIAALIDRGVVATSDGP